MFRHALVITDAGEIVVGSIEWASRLDDSHVIVVHYFASDESDPILAVDKEYADVDSMVWRLVQVAKEIAYQLCLTP